MGRNSRKRQDTAEGWGERESIWGVEGQRRKNKAADQKAERHSARGLGQEKTERKGHWTRKKSTIVKEALSY